MIIQAGNAVAAWIYLWMTFQLGFYESTDLLPRVSGTSTGVAVFALPAAVGRNGRSIVAVHNSLRRRVAWLFGLH